MLNIITAFKVEAAPLIEGLSLKPADFCSRQYCHGWHVCRGRGTRRSGNRHFHHPWRSPRNSSIFSGCGVQLGISGPGCTNAQALTDYFLQRHSSENQNPELTYWLNFGIAGSAAWEIGELVRAHTVTDQATGKNWTLGNGINLNLPGAHICTVASPQAACHGRHVYDMEAAGIISALSERDLLARAQFRIFCVKIISDGPSKPVESLTKQDIQQMIHGRKKDILAIAQKIYSGIYSASLE
ncbi:hypothetical protein [Candidatus Spongiihabitans sp.]|uniref:hypothetical protein n=1 Tax=Candidatus Spongiihabitans sp. TaxID=3101308 RepID=UPI003C7E0F76